MATKAYTFRFDEEIIDLADLLRRTFGISRTQAIRQSITTTATLVNEAAIQTAPRWDWLIDEYGEDAVIAIRPLTSESDTPQLELTVNGQPIEDAYAVGRVTHDGKLCLVYLMNRSRAPGYDGQWATIGNTMIYIAEVRMPIGEMDWPPNPDRPAGIAFRLGDVGKVPELVEVSET
jgi:hypothetical protein